MTKPIFLTFLLLLVVCFSQVHAITLTPVIRYNETVPAGDTVQFTITMLPEAHPVTFVSNTVEGDCAQWVSMNTASFTVDKTTDIPVQIAVPKDATNGAHRCDITFRTAGTGTANMGIGFPVSVRVSGGTEPTVAPLPTTQPVTVMATVIPTPEARSMLLSTYAGAGVVAGCILIVVGIVAVIVTRRKVQK